MRYSKSWTQAVQEVREQVGVRKVDFVDGITPDLQEAKPEFEVKYASSKKGPIKVSKFMSLEDAKKFLAQVKKEGMNGIISKGGKPVKEDKDLESIVKELEGASKMHLGQSKRIQKHLDKMKKGEDVEEEIEEKKSDYEDQIKAFLAKGGKIQKGDRPDQKKIDKVTKGFLKKLGVMKKKEAELDAKDKEELEKMMGEEMAIDEHCGECGAMDHVDEKIDGRKKNSGKQAKKDNEDRRAAQRKKLGILGPNEETINEADYELYHKTFSGAMQHAYAHAKKKGYVVDPDEIDNKVATGPKKPSSGKTNRYILGTNKKQKLHVQVANLDNKRFELNMYIEETEKENMDIEETIKQVIEGKYKKKMEDASNDKSDDGEGMDKVDPKAVKKKFKDRKDKDLDNDGDTDSTDKYLHKRRKAISKAIEKEDTKKEDHTPAQDTVKGKGSSKDKKPMAKYEETDSPLYTQIKKLLRNK